jgi:DNA-binding PadR family transcriptional regulator
MRIPLPIKPFLLRELQERGPSSGLALAQRVREHTPGVGPWVGQHNLYPALRDLEQNGLLLRLEEPADVTGPERLWARGGRPVYTYRLTPLGVAMAEEHFARPRRGGRRSFSVLYRWSEEHYRGVAVLGAVFAFGWLVGLKPLALWHVALVAAIYLVLRYGLAAVTTFLLQRWF